MRFFKWPTCQLGPAGQALLGLAMLRLAHHVCSAVLQRPPTRSRLNARPTDGISWGGMHMAWQNVNAACAVCKPRSRRPLQSVRGKPHITPIYRVHRLAYRPGFRKYTNTTDPDPQYITGWYLYAAGAFQLFSKRFSLLFAFRPRTDRREDR